MQLLVGAIIVIISLLQSKQGSKLIKNILVVFEAR